ncbi:MAG: Rrf2 family transcriptional regulator [Gaiellales bacterium]
MRLRFSRTADYGLRAALEVARVGGAGLVTRRELADATGAPPSVLAQALASLVRGGLLDATAGPRGGYRLARPPEDISVREVMLAIDPQDPEPDCVLRERPCDPGAFCPFHAFLTDAQERFLESLDASSLADVLAGTGFGATR